MIKKLELIREKIDIIDNKILDLIDKRLKKIKHISILKRKFQIPSFIKERENDILNNKILQNKRLYVSNNLLKDILKRIMYETYNIENSIISYKNYKNYKILFIGSRGNIGKIFKNLFLNCGYKIYEINSTDWDKNYILVLKKVNTIIISVPISKFEIVINKIINHINKEYIIIDMSSIKYISFKIISKVFDGIFLSLHPLFGKNIKSITKQTIILCWGKYKNNNLWIIKQLKLWGIKLIELNYKTHDKYMSYIQSLRYFMFFVYRNFIKEEKICIKELIKYSTPINKLFLLMINKFFEGDINLYLEIIFSKKNNIKIINNYKKTLNNILKILINKDTKKIKDIFNNFKKNDNYFIKLDELNKFLINNLIT